MAKGKGDTDNLQVHILLPSGSEHEIFLPNEVR